MEKMMTPQKVLEAISIYRVLFTSTRVGKIDYPYDEILDTEKHGLEHCHGMLDRLEEFVREGRMEKAFRWLGFIQGVVWRSRIYSLESLKNHNRE